MFCISPYKTFDKCSLSNLIRQQNPGGCLLQGAQQQQRQLAEAPRAYDPPSEHVVSSPTSKQRVSIFRLRGKNLPLLTGVQFSLPSFHLPLKTPWDYCPSCSERRSFWPFSSRPLPQNGAH